MVLVINSGSAYSQTTMAPSGTLSSKACKSISPPVNLTVGCSAPDSGKQVEQASNNTPRDFAARSARRVRRLVLCFDWYSLVELTAFANLVQQGGEFLQLCWLFRREVVRREPSYSLK